MKWEPILTYQKKFDDISQIGRVESEKKKKKGRVEERKSREEI